VPISPASVQIETDVCTAIAMEFVVVEAPSYTYTMEIDFVVQGSSVTTTDPESLRIALQRKVAPSVANCEEQPKEATMNVVFSSFDITPAGKAICKQPTAILFCVIPPFLNLNICCLLFFFNERPTLRRLV